MEIIFTIVVFVIGSFSGIALAWKHIKAYLDARDKADDADSPGGSSVTEEEREEIREQGRKVLKSLWGLLGQAIGYKWKQKKNFKDVVKKIKEK